MKTGLIKPNFHNRLIGYWHWKLFQDTGLSCFEVRLRSLVYLTTPMGASSWAVVVTQWFIIQENHCSNSINIIYSYLCKDEIKDQRGRDLKGILLVTNVFQMRSSCDQIYDKIWNFQVRSVHLLTGHKSILFVAHLHNFHRSRRGVCPEVRFQIKATYS